MTQVFFPDDCYCVKIGQCDAEPIIVILKKGDEFDIKKYKPIVVSNLESI